MEAKFAKILAWDAVFGKKTLFGREVTEILVIKGAFHLGKKPGNFGGSKSGISDW